MSPSPNVPLLNRSLNQGFTLIELLIVIMMVGILSAIAAPSFLGLYNRTKINDATAKLRGALQEAQREAVRKSKTCTVELNQTNPPTIKSSTNCLVTGDRTLSGVVMRGDLSSISFTFKGTTNSPGTVVLSLSDSFINQRCLVIAAGIGIFRVGKYTDNETDFLATKCTTIQ